MSKKDFNNISDDTMTAFFSEPIKAVAETKEKATKQVKETTERQDSNYSICIKVENDLVDFFKNALWITRKSKKDYLNDLIRQDFIKTIGARKNATDDELKELWKNYKKENNL
jgi:uncharacterized protein (DUF4415 family)